MAWSDDGYTIATGNQDRTVCIFDARNFKRPVKRMECRIAGCRALRFSPAGGGRRTLAVAEAADFVHFVDAVGWERGETVEFWGEVGGMEWTPDGGEVVVANADKAVGGLMMFERARGGELFGEDEDADAEQAFRWTRNRRLGKKAGADLEGLFV